jgi:carotenoid cleavage dioxygenase
MASNTAPADLPFHLQGNYAPVREELTEFDLRVEGAIPPGLRGLYVRNGPNPRSGTSPHWFFGDGMVHGVRIENGKAAWYRNRWVRTRPFEDENAELIGPDGTVDHNVAVANTNIIGHAGRIFALVESSFPTELTGELDTLGICDFEGRLDTAMTAHPKLCPVTGEPRRRGQARAERGDRHPGSRDDPRLRDHRAQRGVHGPPDRVQSGARRRGPLSVPVE